MNRTSIMRGALGLGAVFNFGAASMVAFPDSLGRLAGLPAPGPRFYSWMLALLVGLFGGVYLWLARRRSIDRPLVGVAIIGKVGVFAVSLASWQLGQIPVRAMVPAVGDLAFAAIFSWWLAGEIRQPRAASGNAE